MAMPRLPRIIVARRLALPSSESRRPRSSRSARARPGTAGPSRRRGPPCRRCRRASTRRPGRPSRCRGCAMTLPIVARRSPAMTTPPAKRERDDRGAVRRVDRRRRGGSGRPAGSRVGCVLARNSANEDDPALQERARQDRPGSTVDRCSLAALLDEPAHELLGVGLEDLVDLVEDRVDVGVERLLALGEVGGRARPASSTWSSSAERDLCCCSPRCHDVGMPTSST